MIQKHFDYSPLWGTLTEQGVSQGELQAKARLSPTTLAKIGRNEAVSMDTIAKICITLDSDIRDIVRIAASNRTAAKTGTFTSNHGYAIHRWFPYLEGYSKDFVGNELSTVEPGSIIYDPFGGAGTTPLVASQSGMKSYFSEINPAMRFITEGKTEASKVVARDADKMELFQAVAEKAVEATFTANPLTKELALGSFEKYYDETPLKQIHRYREFLHQLDCDPNVKKLLRLAMAAVAVPSSRMVRRGDLRYKTENELKKGTESFSMLVEQKLKEILEDLQTPDVHLRKEVILAGHDAIKSSPPEKIDYIITSPPYLNGTNYFRNTKLELRLLDMVVSEKEMGSLFKTGITAGINNVSSSREPSVLSNLNVKKVHARLQQNAYDKRIPKMVAGYFFDMQRVAKKMFQILSEHGTVCLDIGDSQFGGIHVPTHDLLTEVFEQVGFQANEQTVIRSRRSRNGMMLTQRILRFEKR